jgi:hypothetical protein
MTSPGGKLTAMACHLTKKVNKADELTYLLTNIDRDHFAIKCFVFFSEICENIYRLLIV